jgi:hypothetical protein
MTIEFYRSSNDRVVIRPSLHGVTMKRLRSPFIPNNLPLSPLSHWSSE